VTQLGDHRAVTPAAVEGEGIRRGDEILRARVNWIGEIDVLPSTTETVVEDERVTPDCEVSLQPTSALAAAMLPKMEIEPCRYVPGTDYASTPVGQFEVRHPEMAGGSIEVLTAANGRRDFSHVGAYDVTSFTLMVWCSGLPPGAIGVVFARKLISATNRNFDLIIGSTGALAAVVSEAGVQKTHHSIAGGGGVLDSRPHWIVWSLSAGVRSFLAVDGDVLKEKTSGIGTPDVQVATVRLGISLPAGSFLGEVRLWNRYISPGEMRCAIAPGADVDTAGLVLWTRARETSGTVANDSSATANNGTVSGVEGVDFQWSDVAPAALRYRYSVKG